MVSSEACVCSDRAPPWEVLGHTRLQYGSWGHRPYYGAWPSPLGEMNPEFLLGSGSCPPSQPPWPMFPPLPWLWRPCELPHFLQAARPLLLSTVFITTFFSSSDTQFSHFLRGVNGRLAPSSDRVLPLCPLCLGHCRCSALSVHLFLSSTGLSSPTG